MAEKYDPEYARKVLEKTEKKGGHKIFFENFQVYQPENLRKQNSDQTRLYLANHLSHADYLLAWLHFHRANVKMPMIAAGKNLDSKLINMIGIDFGKLGAFWVDRDKINGSDRQEAINLRKKVEELVQEGEDILCFPESGRSYSGRLFETYKTGIIKAVLKTNKDIEIVPMAFDYTKRIEENYLPTLKKVKGRGKLGNATYIALDAAAFLLGHLSRRKGDIYLNIGKPISLEDISNGETSISSLTSIVKEKSTEEIKRLYREIKERRAA